MKYQKLPDDPFFEDMDASIWLWMYQSWLQDQEDKQEFAENQSIFTGSFSNPEMAKRIIKTKNPDYQTDDKDFDRISEQIVQNNRKELEKKQRRRRRALLQDKS